MPVQQSHTPTSNEQQAVRVKLINIDEGTKKSSPATMTMQDWIQRELAKAPPLTQERQKKIKQLLLG